MKFNEKGWDGPFSIYEVSLPEDGYPGVYVLLRRGSVAYVGRADSNLRTRLGNSINEGEPAYDRFWVYYETSPMQAYKRECKMYHKYDPIDNTIHPAVPGWTNWRCPVKDCEWG